jgi:bifunctional DNase/RNase
MMLDLSPLWHRICDLWRRYGSVGSVKRWFSSHLTSHSQRQRKGWVKQEGDTMVREMKVLGLTVDRESNTPIVVLKDPRGETMLPIVIGRFEASAITAELEQISFVRPMTHDLIRNLLVHLQAKVERVEVCDLRDDTFYAWIYLMVNSKETRIDARPSDALAIALRTGSPIYVNERVLQKSGAVAEAEPELQEEDDEEAKAWSNILRGFQRVDFRGYEL